MEDIKETAWDHIYGEKTATFSTSEKKWIREIQRLHEEYPGEVAEEEKQSIGGANCGVKGKT